MTTFKTLIKRSQAGLLGLALVAGTISFSTIARAHDGMEDVTGTVQMVNDKMVSVKTTKGKMMDVKLDASTEYTRGKAEAKVTDLKTGDRVVIHAMEMNGAMTAHLVQLPAAKATTTKAAPKAAK